MGTEGIQPSTCFDTKGVLHFGGMFGHLVHPPFSLKSSSSCSGCQFWFHEQLSSSEEGIKPSLYRWQGSLFWWVGVFHVREVDRCSLWFLLTCGVLPISLLPTVTQFHEWSHSLLGSLSASINGHQCCSLHHTHVFLPRSPATSHYLWSSPIFSGCSSRCPW